MAPILLLNHRIQFAIALMGWLVAIISAAVTVATLDVLIALLCVPLGLSLVLLSKWETDVAKLFLATHPTILYLGTTLLYAVLTLNLEMSGFVDIDKSLAIVAIYQSAVYVAYVASKVFPFARRATLRDLNEPTSLPKRGRVLFWVCLAIFAASSITDTSQLNSLVPILMAGLCLGLGLSISHKPEKTVAAFLISTVSVFAIAVIQNERTAIFVLFTFWSVVFLYRAKRLFTARHLLLAFVALLAVNWVTYAFLTARNETKEGLADDAVGRTLAIAFSLEGLAHAIPILGGVETPKTFSARSNRYYSDFLQNPSSTHSRDLSVFGRLSQMAHMDIVTSRIDASEVKWDALWQIAISVFPNVGQEKLLVYSDILAWDLGLRDRTSVGRPLVTVAGEIYTLGGYAILFLLPIPLYFLIFVQLSLMRHLIGYNVVYVGTMIACLHGVTATGSLLAILTLVMRNLPFVLVLTWSRYRWRRSRNEAMGAPSLALLTL